MKNHLKFFAAFCALSVASGVLAGNSGGNPQPAILGATGASNSAIVYPDATALPSPGQTAITGMAADASPHGVAYFGSDSALISDFSRSRIYVAQISTATVVSTIDTSSVGYSGTGTIAVAPNLSAALAMGGANEFLRVIEAPFDASSTINSVTLPGRILAYQTQAIVFNNAGRAFVYHTTGISVLDPPYSSVAFTIPATNAGSGAIGITPDGNTLLTTDLITGNIGVFHAPFSASSLPETLAVAGASGLDGIMVAPDGTTALVVSAENAPAPRLFAVSAPFSSTSSIEVLPLPAEIVEGFEDVGISADSQVAIVTGNSANEPPVFVQAPFTAANAQTFAVAVAGANPARGAGAVRFIPPGLAPGLTISKSAPSTTLLGSDLTYTLSYANTGGVNAANVVIRDPLPNGTTFVSASNGGTVVNDAVVFNIGPLNAGGETQTVTFTVRVTAAAGASVINSGYTIQADGFTAVTGPPVTTEITTPQLFNLSTRGTVMDDDKVLIGGFMILGTQPKRVVLRGIGPSMTANGLPVPGRLANPALRLMHDDTEITANTSWRTNEAEVEETGVPPSDDAEAAIVATLDPGNYTIILSGENNSSGVGLVEMFDLNPRSDARFGNLSTRGMVGTGDLVLIGGLIVGERAQSDPVQEIGINGQTTYPTNRFIIRAIGPSMMVNGELMEDTLQNPQLDLFDANGALISSNDDWRDTQEQEIEETGLAPEDDRESAIVETLAPGNYTAIVRGANQTTGVGLVEIFQLTSAQF